LGDLLWPVERSLLAGAGSEVIFGIRPEDLQPAEHGLAVEVDRVEELGADAYASGCLLGSPGRHKVVVRTDGRRPPKKGETVHFAPKSDHVHLFNAATNRRLGL
jgi:multiple sugar transport system ATP-binding protein